MLSYTLLFVQQTMNNIPKICANNPVDDLCDAAVVWGDVLGAPADPHGGEAVHLPVGGLRLEVRQVGRAHPPQAQAHRGQTLPLQTVRQSFLPLGPPGATHEAPLLPVVVWTKLRTDRIGSIWSNTFGKTIDMILSSFKVLNNQCLLKELLFLALFNDFYLTTIVW